MFQATPIHPEADDSQRTYPSILSFDSIGAEAFSQRSELRGACLKVFEPVCGQLQGFCIDQSVTTKVSQNAHLFPAGTLA